ncbi:hypothetical protein EON80_31775 [bacterium]|nr:MAG: hypothetical protein EON80_31775 [bacterium]
MTKILNPRFETVEGKDVCLCGEPSCNEVLATIVNDGAGPALELPSLVTEVGVIKGVKRYARDMAQEFTTLDAGHPQHIAASQLPIVVVCPASHQENLISPEFLVL